MSEVIQLSQLRRVFARLGRVSLEMGFWRGVCVMISVMSLISGRCPVVKYRVMDS